MSTEIYDRELSARAQGLPSGYLTDLILEARRRMPKARPVEIARCVGANPAYVRVVLRRARLKKP